MEIHRLPSSDRVTNDWCRETYEKINRGQSQLLCRHSLVLEDRDSAPFQSSIVAGRHARWDNNNPVLQSRLAMRGDWRIRPGKSRGIRKADMRPAKCARRQTERCF